MGISYLPQESSVFRKLTVRQNLQIILEHTGLSRKEQKERADVLLEERFAMLLLNAECFTECAVFH